MKVSELIAELQFLSSNNGDMEITFRGLSCAYVKPEVYLNDNPDILLNGGKLVVYT